MEVGKRYKKEVRTFWTLFFFFAFTLLKTTKICFGSTKMGIFYREKAFHTGKKSGKMTLPPQKNMSVTPLHTLQHTRLAHTYTQVRGDDLADLLIAVHAELEFGIYETVIEYLGHIVVRVP